MTDKRIIIKKSFTLVELIVSLGVFSILLLVSSIIFTTAQKAWSKSTETKIVFENVRVVMDLMTADLQSIALNRQQEFTENNINFVAETVMPHNNYSQSDRFRQIEYKLSTEEENSGWIMRSCLPSNSAQPERLIPNVTELKFKHYPEGEDNNTNVPYYLKVTLKILDQNSWEKWISMGGSPNQLQTSSTNNLFKFRKQHERTFTKNILIGNRGQF